MKKQTSNISIPESSRTGKKVKQAKSLGGSHRRKVAGKEPF